MLQTILVPLDGSPLAERVLPYAIRLGRLPGARLVLVRAHSPTDQQAFVSREGLVDPRPITDDPDRERAAAELRATAERLRREGLSVELHVYQGAASGAIRSAAHATGADIIAMSTHGRSGLGRWVYGSVAEEVLRTTALPTLLVSSQCDHAWPVDRGLRVLVPLDGSPLAAEVLGPVRDFAAALGGELTLLGVIEPVFVAFPEAALPEDDTPARSAALREYLEGVAKGLRTAGSGVDVRVAEGKPAGTIAAVAERDGADVIAMATHGHTGLARLVLGSVATGTLQRSGVPLLLLRPRSLGPGGAPVAGSAAAPS
jgi:nucleotide-binding universal stress UspA family protein